MDPSLAAKYEEELQVSVTLQATYFGPVMSKTVGFID